MLALNTLSTLALSYLLILLFCSQHNLFQMLYIMYEILVEDVNEFRTFNQFFTRELKDGARVVDSPTDLNSLVSPCDGKILSIGELDT